MDPNTDDLILLESVKRAEPAFVRGSEYYVLKDSIPQEVREAIEGLILPVKYVEEDQRWCMIWADWLSCRDSLITHLMTRMTRRSLELGITGPSPDDLETAPMLSPWIAILDPQFGGAILVGLQTGHPTLMGSLIHTSRLCGIDAEQTWARTASRWYRLSDPATSENMVQQLGRNAAQYKHLLLEFSQVQAVIEEDLIKEGLRNG